MSNITCELVDGMMLGEEKQTLVTLRPATAGDVIEATEESEKLFNTPEGPALVASPTLVATHMLCKQIVSVGDIPAPISLDMLKKLTPNDMELLHKKIAEIEIASMEVTLSRGRSDGSEETD